MQRRDIVIGLLILIAVSLVVYFISRPKQPSLDEANLNPTVEEQLEQKFGREIPDDANKVELKDVSGGDSSGIVVKDFSDGNYAISVLADVPDTKTGEFYQAWVTKSADGSEEYKLLGKLTVAKGGFVLDYETSSDLTNYEKLLITLEKINDSTPEKSILEGSIL